MAVGLVGWKSRSSLSSIACGARTLGNRCARLGILKPCLSGLSVGRVQHRFHQSPSAVSRVLVLGSGGLSIGQAIKALKEERIQSILVNPNIATVQTAKELADRVYFVPVTTEAVERVIDKERPDGILLAFGGQTALNCGIALHRAGILDRYGVRVLGTPIDTLITSEDRDLFAKALQEINIPIARSIAVDTVEGALDAASSIGYPVIVRSAFSLGGLGSGFAESVEQLRQLATSSLSLAPQILVEKSMKGWKEIEYEVVRDGRDNCITVCNMENFDPLGVHTGDSIVVAPSQTLTDEEYHMLRSAAIKIVRHLGVVGECNVQYALNPNSLEYCVIEMNARLSRSSALASKATGYPLAFVAAKIGLGYALPDIKNAVTKTTSACFEPSLDYVVTKMPRWDLAKFLHVSNKIGSSMKSVGESMAIGRTFEESLQKAIRQVDSSYKGFQAMEFEDLDEALRSPSDRRLFAVGKAMLDANYSVDEIHALTSIDKWFLYKLENIKEMHNTLKALENGMASLTELTLLEAKKLGFSDAQIAESVGSTEREIRALRKSFSITPFVKRIDTLAGEVPTQTNYLYTTYNAQSDDLKFDDHGVLILGSGIYRIGSSVEFDWCAVSCVRSLRSMGFKTSLINYNPETVSTDYDEVDRLYFDELSLERVMDIYEKEASSGVVVSVGGQLPQNMALKLWQNGLRVLGTHPKFIDMAENRFTFSSIMDRLEIGQPRWRELSSIKEAKEFADKAGYPVLVRPSYVLSGAAMNVASRPDDLERFLSMAVNVSPEYPVVISKFIQGAREVDVDAVAQGGNLIVHAVSEHVEDAGVHSGDATLVLPPVRLSDTVMKSLLKTTKKVAREFEITGPFNMQDCLDCNVDCVECNLRASRSVPFVSKVLDHNFIETATQAIMGREVKARDLTTQLYAYTAVKVPQFSWTRLAGADPMVGVEMASTGEVAAFGENVHEAYLTALQSVNQFRLPRPGQIILLASDMDQADSLRSLAEKWNQLGYSVCIPDHLPATIKGNVTRCSVAGQLMQVKEDWTRRGIAMVMHIGRRRPETVTSVDYLIRRFAVDLGIPLVNDAKCSQLLLESLARVRADPTGYWDRAIRSWTEWHTRAS